jgi:hypothetical protein
VAANLLLAEDLLDHCNEILGNFALTIFDSHDSWYGIWIISIGVEANSLS